LRTNLPGAAERVAKRGRHATNCGGVPTTLRLSNDQVTVEQFESLVWPEHTKLDQTIVLDARLAPGLGELSDRERQQTRRVASPPRPVNVREPARLSLAGGRA